MGNNSSDGLISNCYATGSVSGGNKYIGGLAGSNIGSTISNCYAVGPVDGNDSTGGLVGFNYWFGTISNCYATGTVDGNAHTGGLVGHNDGSYGCSTISNCYATGAVDGNDETGGLVGYNYDGTVSASFWDIETTGQSSSAGGEGKTTAEMQTESTFTDAGWDFIEIWNIGENQT